MHVGKRVPDNLHPSERTDAVQRLRNRGIAPHSFKIDVRANAACHFLYLLGDIPLLCVDVLVFTYTQRQRCFLLELLVADQDKVLYAALQKEHDDEHSDGSQPADTNRLLRLRVRLTDRVDSHRHRLQHRRVFEGYRIRNTDQVPDRHAHIFSKRAVTPRAYITVIPAKLIFVHAAGAALSARQEREYRHPCTQPLRIHTFCDFDDIARKFMSRYQRVHMCARIIDSRNIRTADACCLHAQQHLSCLRLRLFHFLKPDILRFMQNPCFHS